MSVFNRTTAAGLAVACAVAAAAVTARAETVIRVSSWAPPTHGMNAVVWPAWGDCIAKASNGEVMVKVEYGLAPPPQQFDVVRDGIADATWMFHGYNPGRFVLTKAVEMPGLGTSAEAASVAYWRVHEKYFKASDEHKGVTLVGLTSHGAGIIHMKEPISSLADLKGKKIRIGGGVSGAVGEALGVVGVRVPAPKVYETLSSGVADGVFMPMETKKSFRLKEVAPFSVIMPGGLYYGSFALLMNSDKLASLSDAQREAVMGCSGEKLSQTTGKMWDDADKIGLQDAKAFGNTITTASDAMKDEYYKLVAHIESDWIAEAKKKGVDGAKVLEELRSMARSY
jgi:TRAP-type C4-dicarboxylate transport system substrate-binding protein